MPEWVHVGVSGWIIQDGNYPDFRVGQDASFALEFYPPHGLTPAGEGPTVAERLSASRYRVRARVVFATPHVWVMDAGAFVAFREGQPPEHAVSGSLVEGEVYLGIDPFFYFEYLHRTPGIPPLTYRWFVRAITREATPWVESQDALGRRHLQRDARREAHVPVNQTDAWQDDGGNADYVLTCERVGGPERPSQT